MSRVLTVMVLAAGLVAGPVACKHTKAAGDAAVPVETAPEVATPAETPADVAAPADEKRTIEGTAQNAKMGAVLVTEQGNVWVDLDAWPDDLIGKKLRAEGRMITRADVPVVTVVPGDPAVAGVPLEAGQDPAQAGSRSVLSEVTWTVLE